MMKQLGCCVCLLAALAAPLPSAEAAPRLSGVHALIPPLAGTADGSGFLERVVREAFRRVGSEIEINAVPAERALINVNTGIDDFDISRASGFETQYPNLVRVPEKTMDFEFVAFVPAAASAFRTEGWASLGGKTVSYVTGWKIFERNVAGTAETVQAPSIASLFAILKQGRSEVALLERWQGLQAAREAGVEVRVLEPPLARAEMFIYLHKRHAEMVPALAAALRQMKADGSYQRMYLEALKSLAGWKAGA